MKLFEAPKMVWRYWWNENKGREMTRVDYICSKVKKTDRETIEKVLDKSDEYLMMRIDALLD